MSKTGAEVAAESLRYRTSVNKRYQYKYGGKGPWEFDCSGLVKQLYPELPHGTVAQEAWLRNYTNGVEVPLQVGISTPGAILFRTGHNGIAIGDTDLRSMEARNEKYDLSALWWAYGRFDRAYLVNSYYYNTRHYVPVQRGSKGRVVKYVQEVLRKQGYLGPNGRLLLADSDYGSYTEFAVFTYQRRNGLWQDGEAGPITQAHMRVTYPSS